MGEAKKRGTFEERRKQGVLKRKAGVIAALVEMPDEALADLYLHNRVMAAFRGNNNEGKDNEAGRSFRDDPPVQE